MRPFLIFDAYGTLVELDDFYHRLQRGFAGAGLELPFEVVQHAAHREMRYYMANTIHVHNEDSYLALRRHCAGVLSEAIREQGHELPLSADEVFKILGEALVFLVFPEVRATLEKLHRLEIPMAVLSNWDYELRSVLRSVELDNCFQFILTSAEVGAEKPDPVFFEKGLARVRTLHPNLTPHDCFYIGDHYEKDVLPARNVGLTPVWLVRDQRDIASGEIHDTEDDVIRIGSLSELLSVLDTPHR